LKAVTQKALPRKCEGRLFSLNRRFVPSNKQSGNLFPAEISLCTTPSSCWFSRGALPIFANTNTQRERLVVCDGPFVVFFSESSDARRIHRGGVSRKRRNIAKGSCLRRRVYLILEKASRPVQNSEAGNAAQEEISRRGLVYGGVFILSLRGLRLVGKSEANDYPRRKQRRALVYGGIFLLFLWIGTRTHRKHRGGRRGSRRRRRP